MSLPIPPSVALGGLKMTASLASKAVSHSMRVASDFAEILQSSGDAAFSDPSISVELGQRMRQLGIAPEIPLNFSLDPSGRIAVEVDPDFAKSAGAAPDPAVLSKLKAAVNNDPKLASAIRDAIANQPTRTVRISAS